MWAFVVWLASGFWELLKLWLSTIFVNVLTTNLPAIKAVQVLVGGHEVDTLAGHVDLRRPLPRTDRWLQVPGADTAAPGLLQGSGVRAMAGTVRCPAP